MELRAANVDIIRRELDASLNMLEQDVADRGWTDEMCGQCRDHDGKPKYATLEALFEQRVEAVGHEQAIAEFRSVLITMARVE